MQNIARIINSHNKKILEETKKETPPCNCRKECPLPGNKFSCRTKGVIYQAEVETEKERKTYIGLTALEFKKRVANHKSDFKHKKNKESTKLSNYIWSLKENNINFKIDWKIIKRVGETRNGDRMCRLCTYEIKSILKNKDSPLNTRNELMNKCRHRNKFLLKNWKRKQKDKK